MIFGFIFLTGIVSLFSNEKPRGTFNESQKARALALSEFDFFHKTIGLNPLDSMMLPKPVKNWILHPSISVRISERPQ